MYETKHKHTVDKEVFFMDDNKVVSGKVVKVLIEIDKNDVFGGQIRTKVKYIVTHRKEKNYDVQTCSKDEDMLFESKSKLIDSL